LLHSAGSLARLLQDATLAAEVTYTLGKLGKAMHNESGWNYLRGVCKSGKKGLTAFPAIKAACVQAAKASPPSIYALGVLLEVYIEEIKMEVGGAQELAESLCDRLALEVDCVREKYWLYRRAALTE
jgi:hypothetical protein